MEIEGVQTVGRFFKALHGGSNVQRNPGTTDLDNFQDACRISLLTSMDPWILPH